MAPAENISPIGMPGAGKSSNKKPLPLGTGGRGNKEQQLGSGPGWPRSDGFYSACCCSYLALTRTRNRATGRYARWAHLANGTSSTSMGTAIIRWMM